MSNKKKRYKNCPDFNNILQLNEREDEETINKLISSILELLYDYEQDEAEKDLDLNGADKEEVNQGDNDDKEELNENTEIKLNEIENDEYFEIGISEPKIKIKDSY